jgi:hypothetical protein
LGSLVHGGHKYWHNGVIAFALPMRTASLRTPCNERVLELRLTTCRAACGDKPVRAGVLAPNCCEPARDFTSRPCCGTMQPMVKPIALFLLLAVALAQAGSRVRRDGPTRPFLAGAADPR